MIENTEDPMITHLRDTLKESEERFKHLADTAPVITLKTSSENFVLEVVDQGIGIPASEHGRIFERFERAVSSNAFSGLGLGLFIAQKIVTSHKGDITVESAENQGAKFTVRIPI